MGYGVNTDDIIQTKEERCGKLYIEYCLFYHRSSFDGERRFGLSCRLYDSHGLKGEDTVYDVTSSEAKAHALLNCLADGFVTPIGMRDVLEELL